MKTIKLKVYEWNELSETAKDLALEELINISSDYAPIPAIIELAKQQHRLFTKGGKLII